MIFDKFKISAQPFITDAYCRNCGKALKVVDNGWFSKALYCPNCENVYVLKMVKVPKNQLNKQYIEEIKKEVNND